MEHKPNCIPGVSSGVNLTFLNTELAIDHCLIKYHIRPLQPTRVSSYLSTVGFPETVDFF